MELVVIAVIAAAGNRDVTVTIKILRTLGPRGDVSDKQTGCKDERKQVRDMT